MIASWRIVKSKHAGEAFTGEGARIHGGRWNSAGSSVLYTAGTLSLAILEMLVHVQSRELLERYVTFKVEFDASLVATVLPSDLPAGWGRSPISTAVRRVGDDWLKRGGSPVLRVPSVIVPSEWNYLLNPAHPDFNQIVRGPRQRLRIDQRLMKPR